MQIFLELYHAGGRMIPALELSVDGVVEGFHFFLQKQLPQVKAYFLSNIIERYEV